MSSDRPHYKLTYFNARGLAEPIRLIFAYAGVEYEDHRIPLIKFTDENVAEMKRQYLYLPLLEIDGEVYTQAFAIVNYLAQKYGLDGADELERFRIHECSENFRDYFSKWVPLFYESTPKERKDAIKQRLLTVDTPKIMDMYNEILVKNNEAGSPWVFGKKMTYADICISHFTINFKNSIAFLDLTENYPAFKALRERVFAQPGIKEWIAKRPESEF